MDADTDNINNAVFTALKPVCDQLIVDVNEKSLHDFTRVLETLPLKAIQNFQSYISFPIEIQILKSSSNQQKQLLVDLLSKLLSLCRINTLKDLLRISSLVIQQIICANNQIKAEASEELKLSVVLCIIKLWKSAMSHVLYDVYCKETFTRLSPVVYMVVQLAKNEKLVKLRVSALECLQILCQVHSDVDTSDVELRQRVRDVTKLMFPGIVSCCVSIASEPATLNHKVTCASLSLWSGVVTLAMADADADPQSTDWLVDAAQKMTLVTEAMVRAQTHSHWQVRKVLASAVHSLLMSCSKSLSASVGSLVCCLIVLSEDEMTEVRVPASDALSCLSATLHHDTGQPLLQLVEAAFYSLLSRAPRIMQGTDDSSQRTCLSLVVGYLRLQGAKLPQVLASGPFLHRLLVTLALICRLDISHITLLEESYIREVETDVSTHEPWKQLLYLNTAHKSRKLQELCGVLRQFADLSVIVHALMDLMDSNPDLRKETVLLLNTILGGGEPECMASRPDLVRTVISVYLQPRLWDMPFSVSQAGISVAEAQSNVVQVSLLAEGVGLLAMAVGGKNFAPCLLRCLYPLLECAGSPLHALATSGLLAVQRVARVCVGGDAGVTQLVCANVDYLSHHITLRLRRAHQSPGVLSVLAVVMRHTTVHVLPSLREIIEDVLAQSYDEFQEHNTNGFLRVFLTFVTCVRGWQQSQTNSASTTDNQAFPTSTPKPALVNQLLEYQKLLNTAETLEDEDDTDPVDIEELSEKMFTNNQRPEEECVEPEPEVVKPVAPSVQLTVAVLQRALHFLPSKDEQRQILVLDILREGVMVIASDEDQLLPVVHKIWSPLMNRFQASVTRPLVIHRAFLLLCTLASTARDFIRSRTLKHVLPSLCQVLRQSAEASVLKDSGSAYRLTQQYKLQRAVLSRLGPLIVDLQLQEREVYQLLVAASPYLSARQPPLLQECCVRLYTQVGACYPDLVWLQLVTLWYPTTTLTPPSPSLQLKSTQLQTCCDETSEFRKNVSELLKFLENPSKSYENLNLFKNEVETTPVT